MFERFNGPARRAMLLAFREAKRGQHDFLGTEHVLFGLLWDSASPAVALLKELRVSADAILNRVEDDMQDFETGAAFEQFPLSPAVRRVFDNARQEADDLGQTLIGPEHLLLGLLREDACEAAHTLIQAGIRLPDARHALSRLVPAERPDRLVQEGRAPTAGTAEPSPEELRQLVAEQVVGRTPTEPDDSLDGVLTAARAKGLPVHTPRDLLDHGERVERQLRLTQLVFGGTLGLLLGQLLGGWEFGVLLGLGGLAIAALRSSLLGAWMGFIGGVMLVPTFAPEFDDTWTGTRLVLGVLGAFLGSFLGDAWRRAAPRRAKESPGDEVPS